MSEKTLQPEEEMGYYNPDVLTQDPYELQLEDLNPSQSELFQHDMHWSYFERLRNEAPVHYCADSMEGP
ncbi:MAG: cytochrome P450, partial [Pseudomonadota bacterium]